MVAPGTVQDTDHVMYGINVCHREPRGVKKFGESWFRVCFAHANSFFTC